MVFNKCVVFLVFTFLHCNVAVCDGLDFVKKAVNSGNRADVISQIKLQKQKSHSKVVNESIIKLAIKYGYNDMLDVLFSELMQGEQVQGNYNNLLDYAICNLNNRRHNTSGAAKYFLELQYDYSPNVNVCGVVREVMLFVRYNPDYLFLLNSLLKKGVSPNEIVKRKFGVAHYPLEVAIMSNNIDWVKLLLKYKASLNIGSIKKDMQPLNWAVRVGADVEIIKLLLKSSSDPIGGNVIVSAIMNRQPHIVKLLLDQGANPNTKDKLLGMPLMFAISLQDIEIVELLIDYGANISYVDEDGESVLSHASTSGNARIKKIIEVKINNGTYNSQ